MASFPISVKAFTRQVDGVSTMDAADVNEAYDEIEALEDALLNGKYNTLSRYAHIKVVEPNGNGDYPTLQAALAGITDASATNRYGILIAPGRYAVNAMFELIKDGIDIRALVPGTVTLYANATFFTMAQVGGVATTSESLVSGIIFDANQRNTVKTLVIANDQPALCRFENCTFIGSNTRQVEFTSSQSGARYRFQNCFWKRSGPESFCLLITGTAPVEVSHCLFWNTSTDLAAPPIRLGAEGFLGRLEYCTIINVGGNFSIDSNVASRTMRIYHCAMNKPMSNVSSSIATPYNVVDANL